MSKQSAGILVFRKVAGEIEVLLVHPGGPFWAKKDTWSIPKGELDPEEDQPAAANREFEEEVGVAPPVGELIELGSSKQGGKTNTIWAVEGDVDLKLFKSNTFSMEWPPRSGETQEFPENDRAAWLSLADAERRIFKGQVEFIGRLADHLGVELSPPPDPEQQSLL